MLTEVGPVEIEVPRDRDGSFEPVIVRKRQRRLDGIDQLVLSRCRAGWRRRTRDGGRQWCVLAMDERASSNRCQSLVVTAGQGLARHS